MVQQSSVDGCLVHQAVESLCSETVYPWEQHGLLHPCPASGLPKATGGSLLQRGCWTLDLLDGDPLNALPLVILTASCPKIRQRSHAISNTIGHHLLSLGTSRSILSMLTWEFSM